MQQLSKLVYCLDLKQQQIESVSFDTIEEETLSLEFIIPFLLEEIQSIDNYDHAKLDKQDELLNQVEWDIRRKLGFCPTATESQKLQETLDWVNTRRVEIAQHQESLQAFITKGENID